MGKKDIRPTPPPETFFDTDSDGTPDKADTDPCGARFTAYTANICAGLMANAIKRELLGQSVPARILYDAASSSFIKQS